MTAFRGDRTPCSSRVVFEVCFIILEFLPFPLRGFLCVRSHGIIRDRETYTSVEGINGFGVRVSRGKKNVRSH